ncbi:hypothetical protein CR513_33840, partial [Mucuna pruriens]
MANYAAKFKELSKSYPHYHGEGKGYTLQGLGPMKGKQSRGQSRSKAYSAPSSGHEDKNIVFGTPFMGKDERFMTANQAKMVNVNYLKIL